MRAFGLLDSKIKLLLLKCDAITVRERAVKKTLPLKLRKTMKNLIYFPGFEVRDINWLKFALLYIDRLNPIIPTSGDRYLGDLHNKLLGETDLVLSHRPKVEEGFLATRDALEEVQNILRNPESYTFLFGKTDFVEEWRLQSHQDYELFGEKYTKEWEDFCVANNLGTPTSEGIKVHKDLGFIFMTLLAQTIADGRAISPITDHRDLDKFSILTRARHIEGQEMQIAQAVINLELPANLSEIELDRIIEVRNRSGFKERLASFHEELDRYFENVENGRPGKFVTSFDSIWKEFSDDILITSAGVLAFGLGVWIALSSQQATAVNYFKEVAGGTSLAVGGAIRIKNTWKNTRTKRYTRKYLADLGKISPTGAKE